MDNNTLSHHGILGMRWGRRRYQNKDGSLTKAGQRRAQRQKEAALEKARKAKLAKKSFEQEKEAAVKSGSAADVLKFKGKLTKQEMDSALARIQWEQNMQTLSEKDSAAGKKKVDKFFEGINSATDKANTVFKAWNTIANVANAFGNSEVQLPKIDTNITSGNRNQRKQEKKKAEEAAEKKQKKQQTSESKQNLDFAEEMRKYNEYNKPYTSDPSPSPSSSTYRNAGGGRMHVNPNSTTSSSVYNTPVSNVSNDTVSRGRSAVQNVAGYLPAPKDDD